MAAGRDGVMAGAQGTELFWRWWESIEPRGCLLLVHGLGEHSGRYDEFSRGLAEVGIMVLAFDLRGHGRSQGSRGDVGAFPHFSRTFWLRRSFWNGWSLRAFPDSSWAIPWVG
jgi:alpha-beta hydrolase superfamily lysophospholipase